MREVTQAPTRDFQGQVTQNPPLRVYDTSGPYTDPSIKIDFRAGLNPLRANWIESRNDTETYSGREVQPRDNGYLTAGHAEFASQRETKGRLQPFPRAEARARVVRWRAEMSRKCTTPAEESSRPRWNTSR